MANDENGGAQRLRDSAYPGRGIVIGLSRDGRDLVQVYWIMGRSPSSRNRVFIEEGDFVKTDLVDRTQEVDPLTLYYPMKHLANSHIVTNGDQTDTIYSEIETGGSFTGALRTRTYEPDAPILTPRISGIVTLGSASATYDLAVLKPAREGHPSCTRQFFEFETPLPGVGHCITTYLDDGDPPPWFSGEPFEVPIPGSLEETADQFWELLNPEHRVSLVVKFIPPGDGSANLKIVNRFS